MAFGLFITKLFPTADGDETLDMMTDKNFSQGFQESNNFSIKEHLAAGLIFTKTEGQQVSSSLKLKVNRSHLPKTEG